MDAPTPGAAASELHGDGWTRLVHPEDLERCLGIRATSFEAQRAVHAGPAPAPPRRRVPLDARQRRAALRDADGAAIGYVGSCVDIHERKELEETLAERTQPLRLAERRQGQFLAMLSHELRNPLAPIANAASVLRTLEHTQPDPGPPARDPRAPGRPARPPGRGADRRHPRRPGPDLAGARAGLDRQRRPGGGRDEPRQAQRRPATASRSTFPTSACSSAATAARLAQALANLIVNAAKFTLRAGLDRDHRPARRQDRADLGQGSRARASTPISCRTPSSCSRSRTRRWPARSAASASA